GGGVEDEIVEVQPGEIAAPGRDRLALEDLERLHPRVGHPGRIALDLRKLADDLARNTLRGDEFALVGLYDRTRRRNASDICGGHKLLCVILCSVVAIVALGVPARGIFDQIARPRARVTIKSWIPGAPISDPAPYLGQLPS